MDNWSNQFKSLLSSPLGVELIAQLNIRKQLLQDEASNAKSQDAAYGLIKEASGVKLAIEHLQFLAVTPKDEGGKVKN